MRFEQSSFTKEEDLDLSFKDKSNQVEKLKKIKFTVHSVFILILA
jgi:hypothetical protein